MASVKTPEAEAAWSGHHWIQPKPRHVTLASGQSVLQWHCVKCGREFITVETSGLCHAVYASALSFYRLSDEVTERWTSEACPGRRMDADDTDRAEKIIAEMPVGQSDGHR